MCIRDRVHIVLVGRKTGPVAGRAIDFADGQTSRVGISVDDEGGLPLPRLHAKGDAADTVRADDFRRCIHIHGSAAADVYKRQPPFPSRLSG